jgi:hypothetical protein
LIETTTLPQAAGGSPRSWPKVHDGGPRSRRSPFSVAPWPAPQIIPEMTKSGPDRWSLINGTFLHAVTTLAVPCPSQWQAFQLLAVSDPTVLRDEMKILVYPFFDLFVRGVRSSHVPFYHRCSPVEAPARLLIKLAR